MLIVNSKELICPDQDALNIIFQKKVKYISEKFNHFTENESDGAIFIHYIGWVKPWFMVAENNTKYLQYYNKTKFSCIPLARPHTYKLAKLLAKKNLKQNRYLDFIVWYVRYLNMKIRKKLGLKEIKV